MNSIQDIPTDLALTAFKEQCEGGESRLGSSSGPLVSVVGVFRNPDHGSLVYAKVVDDRGIESVVPFATLFVS